MTNALEHMCFCGRSRYENNYENQARRIATGCTGDVLCQTVFDPDDPNRKWWTDMGMCDGQQDAEAIFISHRFCPWCGTALDSKGTARRTVVVEKLHEMWLADEPESGFSVHGAEPFTEEDLPDEPYGFEFAYWYDPTEAELPRPENGQKRKGYWLPAEELDDEGMPG